MKKLVLLGLLVVGAALHAEEKTCAVKGMHCEACAASVKEKICASGKYSTCEAKVVDENKELGQIHLVTKAADEKIDEKAIADAISPLEYKLDKCTLKATKKAKSS